MKLNLLKPKPTFWVSLLGSVVFLFPFPSLALTVQEVPNPRQNNGGWVTDMAGILTDKTETQINQMISQLEAKYGTEMAVVTVPKTAPADSPKQFATELFNYWGIGKKGQENGVLFLISVGDRRVEIETGYGVEAILPDAKVGNIIDTQIIPRFKKGDFEGGTLAGTRALVVILESDRAVSANRVKTPNQVATPNVETSQDGTVPWGLLAAGGGILVLVVGGAVYLIRPGKIFIAPEGRTRISGGDRIFLCADCQQPMEKVDATTVESYLSKPEKVAQKLGSVRFEGWRCPNCSQKLTGTGFHIVAHESHSSRFRKCPHCQELTVTHSERTVKSPTQFSSGRRLIVDDCHSCSYHYQHEEIIPRLPPPPPPPPPSSSSWGGFSGGGGSFGGGSSGGGGAGGSW
ncbi:TPM domain-containing protein [Fischerella sp. PCC 9605]|uniref:TPM domain-containing protein n=1 Tax=Fischerella sp. PCC 9605 TaxID=1173024 RepID=UPI00047973A6|nr:TPM domain-containing protein [Fischerella sp. PCC 9605]